MRANKATCPNNSEHAQFVTVATVTEDWLVDREGNYIDTHGADGQVIHEPDVDNIWTCATCGAEVVFSRG